MKSFDKIIFYGFPLILFQFFHYVGIPIEIRKMLCFVAVLLLMGYTSDVVFNIKYSKIEFFSLMKSIFILTFLSIFISQFYWDQLFYLGYIVSSPLLGICYFFFLLKARPKLIDIENLILIYTFVYCIIWIFAFSQVPTVLFSSSNSDEILDDSRGIYRINIVGRMFLVLSFFFALNKWKIYKEKKFILIALVCFLFIILQVTRQVIILSFLIGMYYFIRSYKKGFILICFIILSFFFLKNAIVINENSVIGSMINLSENQLDKGDDDDVRLNATKFFFNDFSDNLFTNIFGNGMPHANSNYGQYTLKISNSYGYYLSDVGYAKMYVITGLLGLVLYVILFIKVAFIKVNENWMYAKLFILYVFLANFGADWYAKPDGIILISICVFLIGKKELVNKSQVANKNII